MDNQIKPRTDQQWICVRIAKNKVEMVDYSTMKWNRTHSIKAMLYTKSGRPVYSWPQLRRMGWRCVKVSLSFEI